MITDLRFRKMYEDQELTEGQRTTINKIAEEIGEMTKQIRDDAKTITTLRDNLRRANQRIRIKETGSATTPVPEVKDDGKVSDS